MAVKIISDVHGEFEALRQELSSGDTAVMLGDYLNLIDFRSLDGILSQVYSREEIALALSEFASGRKELALNSIREIIGMNSEKSERVRELIVESYTEFFKSIPCRSFLLYGNTDDPGIMREISDDKVEIIEAGATKVNGELFGFVSGSPFGPWTVGLPGEVTLEEYRRRVESVGRVDVLCTHYPPSITELTWDRIANRDEVGSNDLLSYLDEYRPARHYFGHVHNPRVSKFVRGPTTLINTGFFKEHRTAFVHEPVDN